MAERQPRAESLGAGAASPAPWATAARRLAEGQVYWLTTVGPSGRPHVRPVLAVWLDAALHFSTRATSRKGKNLLRAARCAIAVDSPPLHLVVEGEAARVSDEARLQRLADAYATKYGWPVTVRDGALYGDGAPTAGPPPYAVYAVAPTTVFGFGADESFSATRWRF